MSEETPSLPENKNVADETREFVDHAQRYYDTLRRDNSFGRIYRDNPYLVLAAAAGAGYIIAGGLLTPFTRRLLRMGTRAMIVPLAATQIKNFTQQPEAGE